MHIEINRVEGVDGKSIQLKAEDDERKIAAVNANTIFSAIIKKGTKLTLH